MIRKSDVSVDENSSCAGLFLYTEAAMTEIKQEADGVEFFYAVNDAASPRLFHTHPITTQPQKYTAKSDLI